MLAKVTVLSLLFCVVGISLAVPGSRNKRADEEEEETYSVTTIEEPPYVIWNKDKTGNERAGGFIPELFKKIATEANIKYDIQLVGDGHYGSKEGTRWNGMMGELVAGNVDIAAAPLTISTERSEAVDFSEPFMSVSIIILMAKDAGNSSIKTMEDLAGQTDVKYGLVNDGTTEGFFSKADAAATHKKMWEAMSADQSLLVDTIADGVKKVRDSKGKYAFLMESESANYYTNQEPCDLIATGALSDKSHYAFAFSKAAKGQAAKTKVNDALAALKTKGEIDAIRKKFWNGGACNGSGTSLPLSTISLLSLVFLVVTKVLG